MAKRPFEWDSSALEVDYAEIPELTGDSDETFRFTEFSRTDLNKYISEVLNADTTIEREVKTQNEDGTEDIRTAKFYKPVHEIAEEQSVRVLPFLALATKGVKSTEYFENANLTTRQIGVLIGVIHDICHIDDLIRAQGNVTLLPMITRDNLAAAQKTVAED